VDASSLGTWADVDAISDSLASGDALASAQLIAPADAHFYSGNAEADGSLFLWRI